MTLGGSDTKSPALKPNAAGLANGANLGGDSGNPVPKVIDRPPMLRGWQEPAEPVGTTCEITLRVAFFFDGTFNSLNADEPALKNSNVARLFRAHFAEDMGRGLYRYYIPGIGTYYPEVGDAGGGKLEGAMGEGGQKRLDKAMEKLRNVIAKHLSDKVVEVRVCAFGFSRGAAEARAFAKMVQDECVGSDANWYWKQQPKIPVHFYFLGLFDTVASVGLVQTSNLIRTVAVAAGANLDNALEARRGEADYEPDLEGNMPSIPQACLLQMAYGPPGADAGAGSLGEGHSAWGGEQFQKIHSFVEKCVHFVAAHEQRNSFPSDTVRQAEDYPANCEEYVYPGVHSDVGGGYEPGELGCSVKDALKLSQIPLLHMHTLAIEHDVPLRGINEIQDPLHKSYFDLAPDLHNLCTHYMNTVNAGGSLGNVVLAHYRQFFKWRFRRIHLYQNNLPNAAVIQQGEGQYDQDRKTAQAQVDVAQTNLDAAKEQELQAGIALQQAQQRQGFSPLGTPNNIDSQQAAYAQAQQQRANCQDALNRANASLAAVPGTGFANSERTYDENLIKDMKRLQEIVQIHGTQNLRPHYSMLLELYDNEFNKDQDQADPDIVTFFDNYVHDSMAAFAKDITLPTDPRSYFMGGNYKIKFAEVDKPNRPQFEVAQAQAPVAATTA